MTDLAQFLLIVSVLCAVAIAADAWQKHWGI